MITVLLLIARLFCGNYYALLRLLSVRSFQMHRLNANALDDPEAGKALALSIGQMTSLQNLEWVPGQQFI